MKRFKLTYGCYVLGDTGDIQEDEGPSHMDQRRKLSFKDTLLGENKDIQMEESGELFDEDSSDDETTEEDANGPWLTSRLTKEKRKAMRKP